MNLGQFFKELWGLFHPAPPGTERPSPGDWLTAEAITSDQSGIHISLKPLQERLGLAQEPIYQPTFTPDTNSMDPVFDFGNNTLLIYGATPEDQAKLVDALQPGDIAVYWNGTGLIIHRILEIKTDALGKIFTMAGDNNAGISDPYVVKPEHIKYICVGTVY